MYGVRENGWTQLNLIIGLIRFVVLVPIVLYWSYAVGHYKLVSRNVELHNGTYDTAILVGEKLARKWSTMLFAWNLCVWFPSLLLSPPLNLPITIVDTVATVYISMATHYQIGYVPHKLKACHDPAGLEMQRPPGTNESFFAAAGRLNETMASPTRMCIDFVKEMQYGITTSVFYALLSFIGIIAFFGALRRARKNNESIIDMLKAVADVLAECLACMVKVPTLMVVGTLFYTPVAIFRCLPMNFKAPVRSARRYAVKTTMGAEQKIEIMLSELRNDRSKSRNTTGPYQSNGGTQTKLSQFLGVYDMLVMVAKYLHYSDLVSLSTVSKSVRESVLPSHDISRRLTLFRRYTCEPGEKSTCWSCTNQICIFCEKTWAVPKTVIFHHVDNCVPYCASCYHAHIIRDSRLFRSRSDGNPSCKCALNFAPNRKVFWRMFNRHTYYNKLLSLNRNDRRVCGNCYRLHGDELVVRNGKSAMTMLRKGLKSNGEKWKTCAAVGCGQVLGTGPRYWICTLYGCNKECKSSVHQAWGSKTDDGVVGEAVV